MLGEYLWRIMAEDSWYIVARGVTPPGPDSGTNKVARGGSWYSVGIGVLTTYRDLGRCGSSFYHGFRCAFSQEP